MSHTSLKTATAAAGAEMGVETARAIRINAKATALAERVAEDVLHALFAIDRDSEDAERLARLLARASDEMDALIDLLDDDYRHLHHQQCKTERIEG